MAAVLAWIPGVGFGLPCAYALWYFADRHQVWTFLGFPTYGGGPFEDVGIDTTTLLLAAFLVVCALEVVAGAWLWERQRRGIILALVLLPFELVFWIGFALPAGPVLGVSRTAVLITGWLKARRKVGIASLGRSRPS